MHQKAAEEKPEMEADETVEKMPAKHPYFIPYRPYRPYFYHHNPYVYFHHKMNHGMEKMPEMKEEEEMPEKHGPFFPFYFAKPEEAEGAEMGEVPAPCNHELLEGHDFHHPPFYYPPITNFPVEEAKDTEVKEDADVEGKSKTISLPVYYHSYFPKHRYTQYKKPQPAKEKVEKVVAEKVEEKPEEAAAKERRRREAQMVQAPIMSYPATYYPSQATYFPSNVQVIKTTVRLAKPTMEEGGEEVVTSSEQEQKMGNEMMMEQAMEEEEDEEVSAPANQMKLPVYYPHFITYPLQHLPITDTRIAAASPIQTFPLQYPVFRYPVYPSFVQAAAAPATSVDPVLPEKDFPLFPKDDTKKEQAALAF